MKFISQPVVVALWASFNSFPPKEAMVALVVTGMVTFLFWMRQERKKTMELTV